MERRSGLGRGLSALIPTDAAHRLDAEEPLANGPALRELAVASIEPNPNQPRVHFDDATLAELAESIRALGVLQPVLVRPIAEGRYQLIAGERRWRAARRAGLDTIPAIVRPTDDIGSVEQALVENLHRQDLTALEEAAAYQQLIEDFELTHEQIAQRVGKSRAAVSNTLRLLQLPPAIQHLLADGRLSAGHARALLGSPDRLFQEGLARRVVAEQLSVRATEDEVRAATTGKFPAPNSSGSSGSPGSASDVGATGTATPSVTPSLGPVPTATTGPRPGAPDPRDVVGRAIRPPGALELENLLSDYLNTRVKVAMGAGRGRLTVEFATLDDLERIYRLITEAPET